MDFGDSPSFKTRWYFIFTVPLRDSTQTIERAAIEKGSIKHIYNSEYHNDSVRGRVLCFRNYGTDIVDRLAVAGFKYAKIVSTVDPTGFGYNRPVIVAYKEI